MNNKTKWIIGGLGVLLVILLATTVTYASKYHACHENGIDLAVDQSLALEFVVKNHGTLQFPSCYKQLSYIGTRDPSVLYVSGGTLLGWHPGNSTPYCWDIMAGDIDCEELCSYHNLGLASQGKWQDFAG